MAGRGRRGGGRLGIVSFPMPDWKKTDSGSELEIYSLGCVDDVLIGCLEMRLNCVKEEKAL